MTTQTLRLDRQPSPARNRAMELLLAPPAILRNPPARRAAATAPSGLGIVAVLGVMLLVLAAALVAATLLPAPTSGFDFLGP